jgi:hypothetical protein
MSKRPLSLTGFILIALSLFVCGAATSGSCNNSSSNQSLNLPGPTSGEIAGVAVGVGAAATAVVLVSVNHAHHTLKGCVFNGPSGLQLRTEELRDYVLTGSTTNLEVGSTVRLHGDRQKHDKAASATQVFLVKELKKSYGPCSVLAASIPSPGVPARSPKTPSMQSQSTNQTHP